jgi:hypothetical protein
MVSHVAVAAVDQGSKRQALITATLALSGRNCGTAKEGEGGIMAVDPVGHLLGPCRMRKRQAGAAHHRHKQMCAPDFTGSAVHHHRHRVAGIVDKQLLPAAVLLAHNQRQSSFPTRNRSQYRL